MRVLPKRSIEDRHLWIESHIDSISRFREIYIYQGIGQFPFAEVYS